MTHEDAVGRCAAERDIFRKELEDRLIDARYQLTVERNANEQ